MATILDMLLGKGTGAVSQPQTAAPKATNNYSNVVSSFAQTPYVGASGPQYLQHPSGPGTTTSTAPNMTPPQMSGPAAISTPSVWPLPDSSKLYGNTMPLTYFGDTPSVHNADIAGANRLTPEMTAFAPQPTNSQALNAANAIAYGNFSLPGLPARTFPPMPEPDYGGVMQPESDPWAGLRSPGEQIAPKAPQPVVRLGTDGYLYTTSTDGKPVSMGRADMSMRPDELYASKHGRTLPSRSEARRTVGTISGTTGGSPVTDADKRLLRGY